MFEFRIVMKSKDIDNFDIYIYIYIEVINCIPRYLYFERLGRIGKPNTIDLSIEFYIYRIPYLKKLGSLKNTHLVSSRRYSRENNSQGTRRARIPVLSNSHRAAHLPESDSLANFNSTVTSCEESQCGFLLYSRFSNA